MAYQTSSADPFSQWFGMAETCARSSLDFWTGMASLWTSQPVPQPPQPKPVETLFGFWPVPSRQPDATLSMQAMWAPWFAPLQAMRAVEAPRQYQPGVEWMSMWFQPQTPSNPFQAWMDAWAEGASRAMLPKPMADFTDAMRDPRAGVPFVSYRSDGGHAVAQIAHSSTRALLAIVPALMAFSALLMPFLTAGQTYHG